MEDPVETDVMCPACGSADVLRKPIGDDDTLTDDEVNAIEARPVDADTWVCLKCDHVFDPYPCPACGSFDLTGALGVSGARYEQPSAVVTCLTCKEEFPPHPSLTA
jgi:predicted RNA-binding Zn-ribbon protein involved in translation (DUF1610 family)